MTRRIQANLLLVGTLAAILLAGCGASQGVFTASDGQQYVRTATGQVVLYSGGSNGYDANGNPLAGYGGSTAYTSSTDTSSYNSTYPDTSTYGSTYDTGSTYGSGSTYGTTPIAGASPAPVAAPVTVLPAGLATDRPGLSAYVTDVNHTGLFGLGKVVCKVQIENAGNITLTGKLRVSFTQDGHPAGNFVTRIVTLRPLEKQVLTFSASGLGINDAEATIDPVLAPKGTSTVSDRK